MKIDRGNVSLTVLMVIFITYLYRFPVENGVSYGLPLKYLTLYSGRGSFLSSIHVNLLYLLGDFIVLYICVCVFRFILKVYMSKRRK